MWTALFDRRRQPPANPLLDADDDDALADGALPSGWHESSWVLASGVEVIELPPAAAERWFGRAA
jgi:hypothetical protein